MGSWTWRAFTTADEGFGRRLFEETVAADLRAIPEPLRSTLVQTQHRAWLAGLECHPAREDHVVMLGETEVGRVVTSRTEGCLHLVELGLIESSRGTGLGRAIVERLCAEAAREGRAFRVTARRDRAAGFYDRIGLPREQEDELQVRFLVPAP